MKYHIIYVGMFQCSAIKAMRRAFGVDLDSAWNLAGTSGFYCTEKEMLMVLGSYLNTKKRCTCASDWQVRGLK